MRIINHIKRQSILQATLFKTTVMVFVFIVLMIILFGRNYWDGQESAIYYDLQTIVSIEQIAVQAMAEEIYKAKDPAEKDAMIRRILANHTPENKYIVAGYFDRNYQSLVSNKKISADLGDKIKLILGINARPTTFIWNRENIISVNLPVFLHGNIIGYTWAYIDNNNVLFQSVQKLSLVFIFGLGLSVILIWLINKYMKKIGLYLERFSKDIIENESLDRNEVIDKLPELQPVLSKINHFAQNLKEDYKELKVSRLKIQKLLEGISDGFYVINHDFRFSYINERTQELISKRSEELLGKDIWDECSWLVGTETKDKIMAAMLQNESLHWEAEGFGTCRTYEYHAYPFDEGLTVFFTDITEQKIQQKELARLERLNVIGQLAAGISHEVRNPLTTVRGFLQLFSAKPKYQPEKENFALMISEIDRANDIIADFLSLAKSNLNNSKLFNLNDVIAKIFPMLQADAFHNNKEVSLDLTPLNDIVINENEIKQLILNLVRNALEASPECAEVIIRTYQKNGRHILEVEDHGAGIPEDIQAKIGTPFFTTKEAGTGLGLAISMGIVQRHGAILDFVTGNRGTTFRIIFPGV